MESKFDRLVNKRSYFLTRGHDFVEIGGVKWATCNVGAENPTDTGLYFAWGDIHGYSADEVRQGEHRFNWENYKFGDYTLGPLTKYNAMDCKTVLDASNDPVRANWGGSWRLPTREEITKLIETCVYSFVRDYNNSGMNGLLVMDRKDKTRELFLPASGYGYQNRNIKCLKDLGLYWNNSLWSDACGSCVRFHEKIVDWWTGYNRYYGFSVRGVLDI